MYYSVLSRHPRHSRKNDEPDTIPDRNTRCDYSRGDEHGCRNALRNNPGRRLRRHKHALHAERSDADDDAIHDTARARLRRQHAAATPEWNDSFQALPTPSTVFAFDATAAVWRQHADGSQRPLAPAQPDVR